MLKAAICVGSKSAELFIWSPNREADTTDDTHVAWPVRPTSKQKRRQKGYLLSAHITIPPQSSDIVEGDQGGGAPNRKIPRANLQET